MREALIKLLFEEYKQICLFEDLEKKGIEMTRVAVDNLDAVIDLVGFPSDNTLHYDILAMNGQPHDPDNGLAPDDNLFCRDWLYDKHFDITDSIDKIQKIEVTDKGLKMTEVDDERLIKEKLGKYVDWLYKERDRLE